VCFCGPREKGEARLDVKKRQHISGSHHEGEWVTKIVNPVWSARLQPSELSNRLREGGEASRKLKM
jgi:hypothetical protein